MLSALIRRLIVDYNNYVLIIWYGLWQLIASTYTIIQFPLIFVCIAFCYFSETTLNSERIHVCNSTYKHDMIIFSSISLIYKENDVLISHYSKSYVSIKNKFRALCSWPKVCK